MKKESARPSRNGREPITEVAQIPFALIQAQTSLSELFEFTDGDSRKELVVAYDLIHSILNFIAGGGCDLSKLQLTDAQREAVELIIADPGKASAYCKATAYLESL